MTPLPDGTVIRPATVADAGDYATCYVESLAETYAHIMPPDFARVRRERLDDEAAAVRDELQAMHEALQRGETPTRMHWVAETSSSGRIVGIVSAGPGVPEWEREHFAHPEPAVEWNLDHLYTRRSTHGSGIGQALFDVALTDPVGRPRGAWLWILRDNPRAEAFYRRNGLRPDGLETICGASWFHRPMFRMWRPDPVA